METYWLSLIATLLIVNAVYTVFIYYVLLKCLKIMEHEVLKIIRRHSK